VIKERITTWLYEIYSACLSTGYIPIQWMTSRIVFPPKAEKCSHARPKNYRPINLTSFTLKTLEKLLDLHIGNDV